MEDTGTCHSVIVPYAACQNTDDTNVFVEEGDALLNDMTLCGESSSDDSAEIAACLTEKVQLSTHCIHCWSELMHCAFTACDSLCTGAANSPTCNECMGSQCQDALNLCSQPQPVETPGT